MLKVRIPKLGGLVADVWVDERHRRELEVTKNPIEYGSPITDHAFVKARQLTVTFGVTNTPMAANDSFGSSDRVSEAREKLFKFQDNAELLTVITISGGEYKDCLLAGIGWVTDSTNPHSTIFSLDLEEVKITKTEKTDYVPLPDDPRTGAKTDSTKKRGEQSKEERDAADEARRQNTADEAASEAARMKAEAAKAQAEKVAAPDDRSYLKQITDYFGGK